MKKRIINLHANAICDQFVTSLQAKHWSDQLFWVDFGSFLGSRNSRLQMLISVKRNDGTTKRRSLRMKNISVLPVCRHACDENAKEAFSEAAAGFIGIPSEKFANQFITLNIPLRSSNTFQRLRLIDKVQSSSDIVKLSVTLKIFTLLFQSTFSMLKVLCSKNQFS